MVTKLGTAKQTLRKIDKAADWILKCAADGIAEDECVAAADALAELGTAIATWIERQT